MAPMSNIMNLVKVVSISTLGTEPLLTGSAINLKLSLLLRVGHEVEGLIIHIPMCHIYNTDLAFVPTGLLNLRHLPKAENRLPLRRRLRRRQRNRRKMKV